MPHPTLIAQFQIVTPLFMSGADQNQAELRLPSIKGALRFWWRAVAWSEHRDLTQLRSAEERLFGSTKRQADLLMRLDHTIAPATQEQKWGINSWQGYTGYGLCSGPDGQFQATKFLPAGSRFSLTIRPKTPLNNGDRVALNHALTAMGLLGSLGGRHRKGWGSITLVSLSGLGLEFQQPSSRDTLVTALEQLRQIGLGWSGKPPFTAFSPATEIRVGQPLSSWNDAQKALGERYLQFLTNPEFPKPNRVQFGLPRPKNANRRASPLFLHVHALPDGKAIPVMAYFPAEWLEGVPDIPFDGQGIRQLMNAFGGQ